MGWVTDALKELRAGRPAHVRPVGGSMRGRIESGQAVTIAPVDPAGVRVDDVVLVAWKGNHLLHLVKEATADQLLIGNNLGKVNGWVPRTAVVGKVTDVRPDSPVAPPPSATTTPCPYCEAPLATDRARQCFACGTDWRDPQNVVCRKNPDWNRFGLKWDAMYVVELCHGPDGRRYTKYREVGVGEADPHTVFETPPFAGRQWVAWGFYEYAHHVATTTGERFTFDAHGVWLTETEAKAMHARGRGQSREPVPWSTVVPPVFPPK